MEYLTKEVQLQLPDDNFRDATINILMFHDLKTTLVISRGELKESETLESNFEDQIKKFKTQRIEFRYEEQYPINVGINKDIPAIEVKNQFKQGNQLNYQMQMACVIPNTRKTLFLSYMKNDQPLGENELNHWQSIKNSLNFDKKL